jgi:hypothetical protein
VLFAGGKDIHGRWPGQSRRGALWSVV